MTAIVLDATALSLRVVLGEAKTTTDPSITGTYSDHIGGTSFGPARSIVSATNGTAPVDIVSGIASPNSRAVKVRLLNIDTVPHTVSFSIYNTVGTVTTPITKVYTLAVNEAIENDGDKWVVYDANGVAKWSFASIAVAVGKLVGFLKSITFDGTDGTTMTFPSTSATIARTDAANTFAGTQTFSGTVTPQGLIDSSGASAGQIKFPSTQNASADANTLDAYAEKSFTGTLTGCTTAPTFTFYYTKIGNAVTIMYTGSATSITGTSNANTKTITGVPAEIRPSNNAYFFCGAMDDSVWQGSTTPGYITSAGVITLSQNNNPANISGWFTSGTFTVILPAISYTLA